VAAGAPALTRWPAPSGNGACRGSVGGRDETAGAAAAALDDAARSAPPRAARAHCAHAELTQRADGPSMAEI
jgi:hypothetical protein